VPTLRPFLLPLALLFGLTTLLPAAAHAQQTWRVLLIIKRKTEATCRGVTVNATMDDESVEAVKKAFATYVPAHIQRLSGGQVRWVTHVIDDKTEPLRRVVPQSQSCWPDPADVLNAYGTEAFPYDSVFVYWLNTDPARPGSPQIASSQNFGTYTQGKGYSTVAYKPKGSWTQDSEDTETFIHEWLHELEGYYDGAVYLPRPPKPNDDFPLHAAPAYGFAYSASATGPLNYWKRWYQAFLQGTVGEPGGSTSGLGNAAWSLGTITERRLVRVDPANSGLEHPNNQWRATSWSGKGKMYSATDVKLIGDASGVLIADAADDLRMSQTVSVRPHTRYIFSAWVKTENVQIIEPGGRFGANLSLFGQPEASRSLTGTQDWTFVSLPFNSGTRTSVELALRLGHHGSTARGKVFFDKVRLVEVR
jgi:hypothetical protein